MAPANEEFVDIEPQAFEKEYLGPIHRVGFWTCIAITIAMALPTLLLLLLYGVFPPGSAIAAGLTMGFTFSLPFFFIEPIAYYSIYGDAGNYMSMTAGNVSNLRLPCAAVAQEVAGVPEGTRKGALIACIGIAVSIILGVTGVLLGALATDWIQAYFPEWVKDAFSTYLLPAVFGAVFGEFTLRGPRYAPVALLLSLVPIWLGWKAYFTIPIAVFGTILFGWAMYKQFRWGAAQSK